MKNKMNQTRNAMMGFTKRSCTMLFIAITLAGLVTINGCSSIGLMDDEPALYYNIQAENGSGIMDCSGDWIVGPVERENGLIAGPMVNGLAPFHNVHEKYYTYIDRNGEFPFDAKFDYAMPFSEGLAAVQIAGKWGFIDATGEFVVQPEFANAVDPIGSFNNGLANVAIEVSEIGIARSWMFINTKGEKVLGPYSHASPFSDGYASVFEKDVSGFINTEGEYILQFSTGDKFRPAGEHSGGLFPVKDIELVVEEGRCGIGYMDKDGKWIVEPEYCVVGKFNNGLAPVSRVQDSPMRAYGYINPSGDMVIKEKYDLATTFSDGCARVIWGGIRNFGLIDTKGKLIYQYPEE